MKLSLKTFLPRSLFGRSLMILAVPVLLIQLISTIVFFDRHWSKVTSRLAFAVAGEAALIAGQIEADDRPENVKNVTAYAAQNLQFLIDYDPGQTLGEPDIRSQRSAVYRALSPALEEQARRPFRVYIDMQEKWVEIHMRLENGVLRINLPQRRLFSSSGYIFLLWMIAVSLVLLAIAVLFMRNQVRPIRRLAVAADRFGRGLDVPASFKPEGAWEVRQAGQAFIEMQERIKRQIQQRTAMLAGISHDLRTPLTRMKLQIAMLENTPDTDALKDDIADMEKMIGAYLDFARGEAGENTEYVNLKATLERIAISARKQNKIVTLEMEDDLGLKVRPVAFERCLNNLVSNAKKYADHIWIKAGRTEEGLVIVIEDNGPGIPEDQMAEVLKPFYRVEGSRNSATGGVGLGLPIVQDIIHSHGGEIELKRSDRGGLCVRIILPA